MEGTFGAAVARAVDDGAEVLPSSLRVTTATTIQAATTAAITGIHDRRRWIGGLGGRGPSSTGSSSTSSRSTGSRSSSTTARSVRTVTIDGYVATEFEPVLDAFAENFDDRGEVGAAVCVYVDG